MAHYAEVIDGVVTRVIVAEKKFIESGSVGDPGNWIQTSYNTKGGQHSRGKTPLRKNFAGVGYTYDADADAFIPPQPYPSWTLNEETCLWEPPVPNPGGFVDWDEDSQQWVAVK